VDDVPRDPVPAREKLGVVHRVLRFTLDLCETPSGICAAGPPELACMLQRPLQIRGR
jgi:hypothetical protein